jgi:hypothetical protein
MVEDGKLTVVAGTGEPGFADGAANKAQFLAPRAIALGPEGRVYLVERGNHRVRLVHQGRVSTVAGSDEAGQQPSGATAPSTWPTAGTTRFA